jgi:FixJ family two-component response regulator
MGGLVYLVDDDRAFRESATWWLKALEHEVEPFDDPYACLEALSRRPGPEPGRALLADLRMPRLSGLQLAQALADRGVCVPVILVSAHADVPLAVEAMRRGVVGVLEKPVDAAALERALKWAFDAGRSGVLAQAQPSAERIDAYVSRVALLTPRERQVFDLIVAGRINKVIANTLGISIKTVELHRKRMMEKMRASSLRQLLRMAMSGAVVEDL